MQQRRLVADFRSAARSDSREVDIRAAAGRLCNGAECGDGPPPQRVVLWPCDRDLAAVRRVLRMPLAQFVWVTASSTSPIEIHTRGAAIDDFLMLAPTPCIRVVIHLNAEEAALRWERADAAPGRRLAAARRLVAAGWRVAACIGPVRMFSGWRAEYRDIAEQLASGEICDVELSFVGDDIIECHERVEEGDAPAFVRRAGGSGVAARVRSEARRIIAVGAHGLAAA